jgi:hypothetical protein
LRHSSWPVLAMGTCGMIEYVYFLFAFPVEAWHFHRRAMTVDREYSQHLRDSYIAKFPESKKSKMYQQVNENQRLVYEIKSR